MKKVLLFAAILALALAGCNDKVDPKQAPQLSASGTVDFEAAGGSKTFAITANINWTVTGHESVAWLSITPSSGNGNQTVTATATENAVATARSAELTITAVGVTSVKVTVTQAAAAETPPAKVSLAAIGGVTPPVASATPVTAVTETAQYTGAVAWAPAAATFGNSTAYTATITLTPKTGYTLTGVAANFFTVASATTATNPANSGVITAVFPSTAASTPAFVAVTNITGVPTAATVGTPLTLSGTVAPTNATNKTIVWTVKSGSANIAGDMLLATAAGTTVVVTATVVNGATATTPYTRDFNIVVSAPAPTLALSHDTLNFEGGGGNLSFTVTSNTNWSIGTLPEWLTVTPASGTGNGMVTVTTTPHSHVMGLSRWFTITVSGTGAGTPSKTIYIVQRSSGGGVSFGYTISMPPILSTAFTSGGETRSYSFTTGAPSWTASSNQSWCTVTPASGSGNGTLQVKAAANATPIHRTATITISGPNVATYTFTVTQEGAQTYSLTLSQTSLNLAAGGEGKSVLVTRSDLAASWTASSNQPWCKVTPTTSSTSSIYDLMVVEADLNTTTAQRTATITVIGFNMPVRTITVTQGWAPTVRFTTTTKLLGLGVRSGGQSFSNSYSELFESYQWTSSETYEIVTSGLADGEHRFSIAWADDVDARKYPIIFTIYEYNNAQNRIVVTNNTARIYVACSSSLPIGRYNFYVIIGGIKSLNTAEARIQRHMGFTPNSFPFFPRTGGQQKFILAANSNWTVSSDQPWCTVSPSSGSAFAEVTITVSQNLTSVLRSAKITISGISGRETITISQYNN